MDLTILELFFPQDLLNYFDLVNYDKEGDVLHLYFEEHHIVPDELKGSHINSHGFHKEVIVQDFPIRGHQVLLHIKRRRWKNITNNTVHSRDWNLVSSSTKLTQEFASFLKELSR